MLQCAVCGEGPRWNDRWTTCDETMGTQPLPFESKLSHISCKARWASKMTHDNLSEFSYRVTGEVTDRRPNGEWFIRE
jgi:hypothetical protein